MSAIRKFLGSWRDVMIINDEAHYVYGERRVRSGDQPEYIKWNKIIEAIDRVARVCLVADLSATPWYGPGSPKPDGALFEWLVSDFSVYDAFESGLVKVVRVPDPDEKGNVTYLDLWDRVRSARSSVEYLSACRSAIASLYASWVEDFNAWSQTFH